MPLKLLAPLYETFTLDRSDKRYENEGEATTVTIKQAAQHEHERRQQLFATLERRYSDLAPDEMTLVQTISMEEIKRMEVYLTLCECNIEDEDGKMLFPSRKGKDGHPRMTLTNAQFNEAWGKLPPDIAVEIHEKVLDVNFIWKGASGEDF